MSDQCEHQFQYQCVVYSASLYPLPGSGAHARQYEDRYYCTKCLQVEDRNLRTIGNTYDKPVLGTFPK